MTDLVLLDHRERIVTLTINRPDKRNALDWPTLQALDAAVDEAGRQPGARAILLRGEGQAFSSGIDLTTFMNLEQFFGEGGRHNLLPITQAIQAVVNKFERSVIPTIALLHGYALGLACELALACDFRIAAEGTRIALPETQLGIIPDVGGTTRLTRLIGPARAKEYILTGKDMPLDAAERWGLLNAVVPADDLMTVGESLAGEIAGAAPLAVSLGKRVIDGLDDIDRGLQLEAMAQAMLTKTEDFGIGVQAAMMRQAPEWKGK